MKTIIITTWYVDRLRLHVIPSAAEIPRASGSSSSYEHPGVAWPSYPSQSGPFARSITRHSCCYCCCSSCEYTSINRHHHLVVGSRCRRRRRRRRSSSSVVPAPATPTLLLLLLLLLPLLLLPLPLMVPLVLSQCLPSSQLLLPCHEVPSPRPPSFDTIMLQTSRSRMLLHPEESRQTCRVGIE